MSQTFSKQVEKEDVDTSQNWKSFKGPKPFKFSAGVKNCFKEQHINFCAYI